MKFFEMHEEENEVENADLNLALNPNYRWLTLFAVMATSGQQSFFDNKIKYHALY